MCVAPMKKTYDVEHERLYTYIYICIQEYARAVQFLGFTSIAGKRSKDDADPDFSKHNTALRHYPGGPRVLRQPFDQIHASN